MDIFTIVSLVGGLALFLFGMQLMGSELEKLSGGKLEKILEKMTDKKYKGVLLGAGVTAVIQSSSAVTVMVVGFVNSGIMQLSRAIGIIMGANVGTTATSWILSLTGIDSSNIFISMLKPSFFAPILAIIGVFTLILTKSEKKKNIAGIITGFSVLMMGMTMMSDAMSPLADNEAFTSILVKFSNPLFGILAGALLTAVIQSSSASVGILQALSITGAVSYKVAFPIILGQNIGTCVTALLSSIGTSVNAKRAAFVHLYFNVIGVLLAVSLFYTGNAIFDFPVLNEVASPAGIAVIHSIFNIFATAILLPFTKQLEFLATKTVKRREEKEEKASILDDKFLMTPSFAIEKCKDATIEMAEMVRNSVLTATELLKEYSDERIEIIANNEKQIDKYEEALETYIIKISSKDLTADDSQKVSILHHAIGNFEKIGDYCEDIVKTKVAIKNKDISFSEQAKYELSVILSVITKMINATVDVFENENSELAKKIEPLESIVDNLQKELKNRHIERLKDGECSVEQGFLFLDIINSLERIADHCSDLAVSMIELSEGDYKIHSYLKEIKKSDQDFLKSLDKYSERYSLN